MTTSPTADTLRTEAARHDLDAAESFDRCDTDGFLSQWASGLTAQRKRMEADLLDRGGVSEFVALFDLDGNPVPARLVRTRYGQTWAVFASTDDAAARFGADVVEWVGAFPKRAATLFRKGYREGTVRVPARVEMHGNDACNVRPYVVRRDNGFAADAVVVDPARPPWEVDDLDGFAGLA